MSQLPETDDQRVYDWIIQSSWRAIGMTEPDPPDKSDRSDRWDW